MAQRPLIRVQLPRMLHGLMPGCYKVCHEQRTLVDRIPACQPLRELLTCSCWTPTLAAEPTGIVL